jgi:hypothetical protein
MSIANLKRSALGMISAAIVLGSGVALAAPATAGPNSTGTDPNPYSGFSCNCQETAPPGSPALSEEINRGIREGHSAWLPGLPGNPGRNLTPDD